jgi:hypothetical protein
LPFPLQGRYSRAIRKDPVKSRVAIPAADPPDNNTHRFFDAPFTACRALLWIF